MPTAHGPLKVVGVIDPHTARSPLCASAARGAGARALPSPFLMAMKRPADGYPSGTATWDVPNLLDLLLDPCAAARYSMLIGQAGATPALGNDRTRLNDNA
jgi:hypothetical protein